MKELTDKQKKVFEYIKSFIASNGYPPTYRELAAHHKVNIGTIQVAIDGLKKKGYIENAKGLARGFIIKDDEEEKSVQQMRQTVHAVPLYGNVAAGEPIFADSNMQGQIPFPVLKGGSEGIFCLRVIGDSMIEKGIFENDILFVRKQSSAEDGNIVVALLEDEATVKVFKRERTRVYLKPANPKYTNITRPFKILGKVIGLKRDYNHY